MARYGVTKYFGHFRQIYTVYADSEDEAWETAELKGTLDYQIPYRNRFDENNKGYVVNLDKKESNVITDEEYAEWLREAVALGMKPQEYDLKYLQDGE